MADPLFSLQNLSAGYGSKEILHHLNLSIASEEFVGIIGPNGSGKSTLLRVLGGLHVPSSGTILLENRLLDSYSLSQRARKIAFLPQDIHVEFNLTVRQTVAMGRYPYEGLFGSQSAEDSRIVEETLRESQLESLADSPLDSLSGGEQQRVWLAACLAQRAAVILLDEPTASLDKGQTWRMMNVFKSCESGYSAAKIRPTVIAIFHDLNAVRNYCCRVIALKAGEIFADGTPEIVLSDSTISRLYDIPRQYV